MKRNTIKPILPSLREKKRYITYKVSSDKRINEDRLKTAINSYIMRFLGELSYARAGIIFLDNNSKNGIIRTTNNYVNELKAALALIDNIENNPVAIDSVCVSGLLNKARSKMEVN